MPYRARRDEKVVVAPETGLVAEMVRQFADPYAFLRELVQNSIDAGATALEVKLDLLPDGSVTSSVVDDGSGMTRAVIEGPLLTLFSTSKEGQKGKIGKYGVGFVSVFALDPDEVAVETWRDGVGHRVRLLRDHSYELEELGARKGHGTMVTLAQRMDPAGFDRHADAALAALRRWCRHAQVPISFTARTPESPQPARVRVDTPFAVHALVSVTARTEETSYAVGIAAGSELLDEKGVHDIERMPTYAGFFNRGLLLHETPEPLDPELSGLRVKVMSTTLVHTLSRDDVKRDAAFRAVVGGAILLARGALRGEVLGCLRSAARDAAEGKGSAEHVALLGTIAHPAFQLPPSQIVFPLTDRIDGEAVMTLRQLLARCREPLLFDLAPSALSAALARDGRPVVLSGADAAGFIAAVGDQVRLERVGEKHLLVTLVVDGHRAASDAALCDALAACLREVTGEKLAGVAIGRLDDTRMHKPALVLPTSAAARLADGGAVSTHAAIVEALQKSWSKRWLVLRASAKAVEGARAAATRDPVVAAHLLCRLLLLQREGTLGKGDNDRLLASAVKALP